MRLEVFLVAIQQDRIAWPSRVGGRGPLNAHFLGSLDLEQQFGQGAVENAPVAVHHLSDGRVVVVDHLSRFRESFEGSYRRRSR